MDAEAVRVVVALPVSLGSYFDPRNSDSIARRVKRSLVVARRYCGQSTVEVILHGVAKGRSGELDSTIVRTEVRAENLDEWITDWATRPAGRGTILDDGVPGNKFEEAFGVSDYFYGRAKPTDVVAEIDRATSPAKGTTLVILGLDAKDGLGDMVRAIEALARPDVFWQIFGSASDIGFSDYWGRDGLRRGGVLPNFWARLNSSWTPRSITRGFRKWHGPRV